MDVDFQVVQNEKSGVIHLEIADGHPQGVTVCGVIFANRPTYKYLAMKMRKFWKDDLRCGNCTRAAKR